MFRKAVLTSGEEPATRTYYEELWPELFLDEPAIDIYNFYVVPDVALILHSDGEIERANGMLTDALSVYRSSEWPGMYPSDLTAAPLIEVEILALSGREDDALNVMRSQIDNGWRFGWWQVESDPVLASIRQRSEFIAMMDEIKTDMAMQLAGMPEYTLRFE